MAEKNDFEKLEENLQKQLISIENPYKNNEETSKPVTKHKKLTIITTNDNDEDDKKSIKSKQQTTSPNYSKMKGEIKKMESLPKKIVLISNKNMEDVRKFGIMTMSESSINSSKVSPNHKLTETYKFEKPQFSPLFSKNKLRFKIVEKLEPFSVIHYLIKN